MTFDNPLQAERLVSKPVNTTHRYSEFCRAKAKDGRVCVLFKDHIAEKHQENHNRSSWSEGE